MADDSDRSASNVFKKLRPWLVGALIASAMGGLFYFLATRGPRRVGAKEIAVVTSDQEELQRISAEVAALESTWRTAEANGQGNSAAARATLISAVEKQRDRVRRDARSTHAESERLRQLEQQLADLDVRETLARVDELEKSAETAHAENRSAEALEKTRAAIALLENINRSSAAAPLKDLPRESRLKINAELLEAEPLNRELMNARAQAELAAREERWGEVRVAFEQVRRIQGRINREYPRSPFADPAAEDKVESQIQSLQADALAATVHDKVSGGEENALAGRNAEAARLFTLAVAAQEKINTEFPKSRQYSVFTLNDLEARRQTALSAEGLGLLQRLDEEISVLLAADDVATAAKKIAEAGELAVRIWRDLPRSRKLDAVLRERVNYRVAHVTKLAAIREAVLENLRSVAPADRPRTQMLTREVSQKLYVLVMDKNPSRTIDESRPVDSVNWSEAKEFSRRLGWLLGRDVALPSEAHYRAVVSASDAKSFIDLSGGVAEWCDASAGDGDAFVAGGSYLDSPDVLETFPFRKIPKTERARHVGFRMIVE